MAFVDMVLVESYAEVIKKKQRKGIILCLCKGLRTTVRSL